MADRYGSVDGVKTRTGVKFDDLGLEDDDALDEFLTDLLDEATDLMDRRMRKSYLTDDEVPRGLDGIASDVVADSLRTMVQSRQTPVVRIDDFAVKTIAARTLSPDIEKRLKLYAAGGGLVSARLSQEIIGEGPVTVALTDPHDPLQTEEVMP